MSIHIIDGVTYWDVEEVLRYNAEIGTPITRTTLRFCMAVSRRNRRPLQADKRIGRSPLFLPDTIRRYFKPDRKPGGKPFPKRKGRYSRRQVAERLGMTEQAVANLIEKGAIAPDGCTRHGLGWFSEDTLQAMLRGDHLVGAPGRRRGASLDDPQGDAGEPE